MCGAARRFSTAIASNQSGRSPDAERALQLLAWINARRADRYPA